MKNVSRVIVVGIAFTVSLTGCKISLEGLTGFSGGGGSVSNGKNERGGALRVVAAVRAPFKFRSLVESLIRQADIKSATAINNIFVVYNAQKNNLPQTGGTTEMTSASLTAVFIIAGQVCGALKDQEAASADSNRVAFKNFNLTAAATDLTRESLVTDSAVKVAGDALTQMFLGRPATEDEKISFVQAKDQVFLGETISAANNKKLIGDVAVGICTAVASSLEAISL